MEEDKCKQLSLLVEGLKGMEDTAVAQGYSTQDDPNMSMLQIQRKLENAVQSAFKALKPKLASCIKALSDVLEFQEKNPDTNSTSTTCE